MRLFLICLLLSSAVSADEINLANKQGYVVPDDKIWVIKSAPVAKCRVCTADVYIKGEASNVEVGGVIFHGNFDFSISDDAHQSITLYPGTEIWLGDSRPELTVYEEPR